MASAAAIAVIGGMESSKLQDILASFAAGCRAQGMKVAGVIAEAHGLPDRTCSAGILRSIASGEGFPIYLGEAPVGTSCHLDARGVDAACASVLDQMPASDLVILSKFGKLEAMRGGLYPAFEAAVAAGKPVVTSVSAKHETAWHLFAPAAASVDAKKEALTDWWLSLKRDTPVAIRQ
jgi:hypothetical protein